MNKAKLIFARISEVYNYQRVNIGSVFSDGAPPPVNAQPPGLAATAPIQNRENSFRSKIKVSYHQTYQYQLIIEINSHGVGIGHFN